MKKTILTSLLWICIIGAQACVFDGTIFVNPGKDLQEMDGFGASGAWWAQHVGTWEDPVRDRIAELLFDRDSGAGMSVYRYNIGAGGPGADMWDSWRSAETFEVSKGVYDWTKDAGGMWFLKKAREYGVENLVAFVNSPPARMTVSGCTTGQNIPADGKGDLGTEALLLDIAMTALTPNSIWRNQWSNLRPEMVEDFSAYLVDVLEHLRNDEGVPVKWISPINEPQWAWRGGQEGCHYTPDECVEVVRTLMRAIKAAGLPVKISGVEAGVWFAADMYLNSLMDDPEISQEFDCFAVHSYGPPVYTPLKPPLALLAKSRYPQMRLWQTEWCEMVGGRDTGMDSALNLADMMHEDLMLGNVASWQYWIAVSKYDFRDGLIYVDESTHFVIQTKRLWAFANYSRFIRPGFVRIQALSTASGLKTTAFRSEDGHSVVLVAINDGASPLSMRLPEISGLSKLEAWETSESRDLEMVLDADAPKGYDFPGRSITTLVFYEKTYMR